MGSRHCNVLTHNYYQQARDADWIRCFARDSAIRQHDRYSGQAPKNNPIVVVKRASEKPPWWRGWPCVSFRVQVPAGRLGSRSYIVWIWAYCRAGASIKGEFEKTPAGR